MVFSEYLLSLNLNKTCYMIFSKRKFPIATEMITINGVALQRVRETKFLRVVISDDLKWKKQVDVVVQKVSKIVGVLYRTCHVLDKDRLKLLYSTLLEPYITHIVALYGRHRTKMVVLTGYLSSKKRLYVLSLTLLTWHILIHYLAP